MTAVTNVMSPFDPPVAGATKALEALQGGARPATDRGRALGRLRFPLVDGVVLALIGGTVVGLQPAVAVVAGAVWAMLTLATAPQALPGEEGLRRSVDAVLRAAVITLLAGWAVVAVASMPFTERQFVGLVVAAVGVATVGRCTALLARRVKPGPVRVLVVGETGDRDEAAAATHALSEGRYAVVGAVGPADVDKAVGDVGPHALLVVPGPGFSGREVQRLAWQAEQHGLPLLVSTRLHDVTPQRTSPVRVGTLSLLHVAEARAARLSRRVKQAWEWLAAVGALLLLAPALAVIAVVIVCDSPGPVFFRQVRVGRNGRPFRMWKFRTMDVDAEDRRADLGERAGHVLFKDRTDPRVTRAGRWLRRSSLDELPQLINVVCGQMALIGPRPGLPVELEQFDEDPMRRLAVAPGITGLWQVSGRSDLSWEETVRLDLDYVDNWSLARDLGIVVRTIRAVLRAEGAY